MKELATEDEVESDEAMEVMAIRETLDIALSQAAADKVAKGGGPLTDIEKKGIASQLLATTAIELSKKDVFGVMQIEAQDFDVEDLEPEDLQQIVRSLVNANREVSRLNILILAIEGDVL